LRLSLFVNADNFAIQHNQFCIRYSGFDVLGKVCEGSERMPIARDQLSTAMLDDGECPEAVVFQFKEPIGVIEWQGPLSNSSRRFANINDPRAES